jgi:FPC/CPF motif-containing protein YcgG
MNRDSDAVFTVKAERAFRQLIAKSDFPCLGAKSALNENSFTFATFQDMRTRRSARELSYRLFDFARSTKSKEKHYASFIAIFRSPNQLSEREFETCLWLQLRHLHRVDPSDWDTNVSPDPADSHFSFSFAGQAFYIVGMHANSSRLARRFRWPTLVFNPHVQFERLRSDGKWKTMQGAIRERELAFEGSINPMLTDFGEASEAAQYSGRMVSADWRAPFP